MPRTGLLLGLLRLEGGGFLAVLLFSVGINLLALTAPLHMLQIYDRVLASMSEMTLVVITGVAVFALAVFGALNALRDRLLARIGLKVDAFLAERTFSAVLRGAVLPGASAQTHALRDVDSVRSFVTSPAIGALCDAPWIILFVGVLYLLHPLFALVGAGGALWLFSLTVLGDLMSRRLVRESGGASIRASYVADAAARNAEVVAALGLFDRVAARWREARDTALVLGAMASDREAPLSGVVKFSRMTLQIGVLSLGAWLVIQRELTPGSMIAASILVGRALAPVEAAVSGWKVLLTARDSWQRLVQGLVANEGRKQPMDLPRPKGTVSVENVTLAPFPGAPPILRNVSFFLPAGEILGVVGPSASGKSSLARLLVGVWRPGGGVVRLDGADVADWNRANLSSFVGYLPQDVELFGGSVKENIDRFSDAPPEAVFRAAQIAGAHEMILRLPDGYDSFVGEGGSQLSGGQRQRVALARSVFGKPALVVLDEPNANLDSQGEDALRTALLALKQAGTTVVIISHRPSVLGVVDKILFLNQGQVEGFGERAEMLAKLMRPAAAAAAEQKISARRVSAAPVAGGGEREHV